MLPTRLTCIIVVLLAGGRVSVAGQVRPETAAAIEQGERALAASKWDEAAKAFRKANGLEKGASPAALHGLCKALYAQRKYTDSADACADGLKKAGADRDLAAALHNQRGLAFTAQAQNTTDRTWPQAEAEFRAALAIDDDRAGYLYNLGYALLREAKDDEARDVLRRAVAGGLSTDARTKAERFIERPRRARDTEGPSFAFTALDARRIDSAAFAGKVVLLDFWGTWCPPCRESTPDLVRIYKKFTDDPNFVMLGISSDDRGARAKLEAYVAEHKMLWPQDHDVTHTIIRAFSVDAYPTLYLIDPEGYLLPLKDERGLEQPAMRGWGRTSGFMLEQAISRALKAVPK